MILWQLRLLALNLTLYPLPMTHSCGHMSRHNTKQNQAFANIQRRVTARKFGVQHARFSNLSGILCYRVQHSRVHVGLSQPFFSLLDDRQGGLKGLNIMFRKPQHDKCCTINTVTTDTARRGRLFYMRTSSLYGNWRVCILRYYYLSVTNETH